MAFGEQAEGRVSLEQGALVGHESVECRVATETRPEGLERAHLERQDPVPIDVRRVTQCRGSVHRLGDHRILRGPRHVLDAQVQRIAIQAARRKVRARFLGQPRMSRVQRVQEQCRCAIAPCPCSDLRKIAEIPDAPVGARPDRVQLHRPPPAPNVLRKGASARAGDEPRPAPVTEDEPVIPERNPTIEPRAGADLAAILELDARGPGWELFATADEERHLVSRIAGKHRRLHRPDVLGRDDAASPCRILVLSLHAPCRQPAGACRAFHAGGHRSQD